MLKPTRDILAELNRMENEPKDILIHGVGRIRNVVYSKYWGKYFWEFNIRLNDGLVIKCSTRKQKKEDEKYLYFEEDDYIEFFGIVHTNESGIFCHYDVSDILIYDAQLSQEKRCFNEVFMWNIKKHKFYSEYLATTHNEELRMVHSYMACIGDIEPQENAWAYGTLGKSYGKIILGLEKMLE